MLDQSRLESAIESVTQTATGFVISYAVWMWVVAPIFGVAGNYHDGLIITSIFTITSLARQYVFRRFFNNNLHRRAKQLAQGIYDRFV